METIKILERLVSFNTIEDLQNAEIIEYIKQYLIEYGFKCEIFTEKETRKKCLVAQIGEDPILAFSGHLDTVNFTERMGYSTIKISYKFKLCIWTRC